LHGLQQDIRGNPQGLSGIYQLRAKRLITLFCLFWSTAVAVAIPSPLDHWHAPLTRLLKQFVRQETRVTLSKFYVRSSVKYVLLKGNAPWTEYIRRLAYIEPATLRESSQEGRKAFWINAYNSFGIDSVAKHYPLVGPAVGNYPIGSFRGNAAWSEPHYVAAKSFTLDQIRTLLADFHDPRVFFAINDCAISSPVLPDTSYDASNIETALEDALTNFLNDPLNYRIDRTRNRLVLSEIFRTSVPAFQDAQPTPLPELAKYPKDQQAILTFLFPRIPNENRTYIINRRPVIEYEPFNWELNLAR
jgi:hypothetical protein